MAKPTEEQQLAIDTPGRVIVSASAGSGKTTVMIEKIIRLIKGDLRVKTKDGSSVDDKEGLHVDELLAVTFTKKAAAQMKEKLSKALMEAINAPETTDEKRRELKERLAEVPNADVSTIHSFCARLLRTHFFTADVDSAFRVIDSADAEGTALKNAALDELFEEGYAQKEDTEFSHLLSIYWRKKSDNALRRMFKDTYEELRARADYEDYLKASCSYSQETFDKVVEELQTRFKNKCRYYREFLLEEQAYFEDKLATEQTQKQLSLATELLDWLQQFIDAPDYFACKKVAKPAFTRNDKKKNLYSEETMNRAARLGALKDKIVEAVEKECEKLDDRDTELEKFLCAGETARALAICLLRFDEKYSRLKKEKGVLDYNDLEHKTLKLLEDEALVQSLKDKYKYVFVDEYQDVNPVQEALISKISGDNLFLVGDVKQSIYGFRGSKSRFFVEKQKEFKSGNGESLKLTRNFRSTDAVLDAVNSQFSLAMTTETSAVNYAVDSYMERGGVYALNSGRVQMHFFGEEKKKKEDTRGVYSVEAHSKGTETEESRLAKLIYTIIEKERGEKYYDTEEKADCDITYGKIAVLSRKKKGEIAKTIASLSKMGIPVTSSSAINVCDYAEVKTLMDILSLLDNAEQDVPLCSALLSPMGNLTADELTSIRLAYRGENTFRAACKKYAVEKEDAIAEKLKIFYAYYEKTRTRASVLNAGELITLLLSETRMEAVLLGQKNGEACLRRIQRFVEEASLPEPMCLHAFLEKLRDMDNKIEYAESGGEDSVKVLTMHASKGLEYPVVILDNLSAPFRAVDHDEVFVEEKYGLAPRAFNGKTMTKSSTLLRRLYEWESQESALADELNLYYVALTRAQYALHLIFEEPSKFTDVLYGKSFADFTDFSVWEKYAVTDALSSGGDGADENDLTITADETLVEEISREYTKKYPYQAYTNLPVKSSATQLLATVEPSVETPLIEFGKIKTKDEDEEDLVVDDSGKTDTQSGLAYHAFLESFDFSALFDKDGKRKTDEELAAETKKAYARFSIDFPKEAELVKQEKATEILCNSIFAELYGMRLYKEQQFLVSLPVKDTYAHKEGVSASLAADNGEKMIFQGAIDLLAVGEQEIRVIDYKYSRRYPKALKEHYKPQLDLYKKAVAKILKTDEKSIRCTIVNIYRGFQVDVD